MNIVTKLPLPRYTIDSKPDHDLLGREINAHIRQHYGEGSFLLRAVSLADNPDRDHYLSNYKNWPRF